MTIQIRTELFDGLLGDDVEVLPNAVPANLTEAQWQAIFDNEPTDAELELINRNADELILELQ